MRWLGLLFNKLSTEQTVGMLLLPRFGPRIGLPSTLGTVLLLFLWKVPLLVVLVLTGVPVLADTQPTVGDGTREIKLALICSNDDSRMYSLHRTRPAVLYAIETIQRREYLPGCNITVKHADSKCNSVAAPIAAFELQKDQEAHVFFGPVCDYSLAPVARYSSHWNIPVITPGGFAHDFGESKKGPFAEFAALTRVGATFDSMASYLISSLKAFRWNTTKVLYHSDGHSEIAPKFCYLAMSAFVRQLRQTHVGYHVYQFDPARGGQEYGKMLREEVSTKYASKAPKA